MIDTLNIIKRSFNNFLIYKRIELYGFQLIFQDLSNLSYKYIMRHKALTTYITRITYYITIYVSLLKLSFTTISNDIFTIWPRITSFYQRNKKLASF